MSLFFTACEADISGPTSDAVLVSETTESQVVEHPEWAYDFNVISLGESVFESLLKPRQAQLFLQPLADIGVRGVVIPPAIDYRWYSDSTGMDKACVIGSFERVNARFHGVDRLFSLVPEIHQIGLKVLMDWYGENLKAEHPWVAQHPAWFISDTLGQAVIDTLGGETYVQLNYQNIELRETMKAIITGWILRFELDGIRCKTNEGMDLSFWEELRAELPEGKAVLFISEQAGQEALKTAFNAVTGHDWNRIIMQEKPLPASFDSLVNAEAVSYIKNDLLMHQARMAVWEISVERAQAECILSIMLPGIPEFVYESGPDSAVYQKIWSNPSVKERLSKVLDLRRKNTTLWAGSYAAPVLWLDPQTPGLCLFERKAAKESLMVLANLGDKAVFMASDMDVDYEYLSIFDNRSLDVFLQKKVKLEPWEVVVFKKSYRKL